MNLLPDMTRWDYELLKASTVRHRVLVPVLKDKFGSTIDGHQVERPSRERGIGDYLSETVAGLTGCPDD
jgi:hypothetical protein